jgi:hypothetical protein
MGEGGIFEIDTNAAAYLYKGGVRFEVGSGRGEF